MNTNKAASFIASVCALWMFCAITAKLHAQTPAADPAATLAAALERPIVTVMDKADASDADKHNYVSYAPCYWPDPDKPDGLPYILRDGEENHGQIARGDYARLQAFLGTVDTLAAAWRANRNEAAARRAGEWLRAWFVLPATRMNPNLEYAQIRPGSDQNRGTSDGIMDARGFGKLMGSLLALANSPALNAEDKDAIRSWFTVYFDWLLASKSGSGARAARNHHATWFIAQVLPVAIYLERDNFALTLCEDIKKHMARQIIYNGSQPEETRGANGLGDSVSNIEAYAIVARAAAPFGVDLWNYYAASRGSLGRAIDYLKPFNQDPSKWPYSQKAELKPGFLDALIKEREDAMKGALPKFEFASLPPRLAAAVQNTPPVLPYEAPDAQDQPPAIQFVAEPAAAQPEPPAPRGRDAPGLAPAIMPVSHSVVVVIQKDGSIILNGQKLASDQRFARQLSQINAASRAIPVFVSMEENAPIRALSQVMEACRKEGFTRISVQAQ